MVWSSQSHDAKSHSHKWSYPCCSLLPQANEIWLLPLASAPHTETEAQKIVSDSTHELWQPHSSPNGRWIVFEAIANSPNPESTLYTVPMSGGRWTQITDSKHWDDKPRWSPDGRTIYFLSGRGGFFNVWGIHFDPDGGKPVGQPFQVSKFESPRLMVPRWIGPVGLSLTQDKLVMTMAEESGSIWVLENVDR
jgi:hypothetical protein